MAERDVTRIEPVRGALEEIVARIARPLLEIGQIAAERRLFDDQLDPEFIAEPAHEVFIAIRFGAAQMMVEMGRGDPMPPAMHSIQQCHRIGSAGERYQNQIVRRQFQARKGGGQSRLDSFDRFI